MAQQVTAQSNQAGVPDYWDWVPIFYKEVYPTKMGTMVGTMVGTTVGTTVGSTEDTTTGTSLPDSILDYAVLIRKPIIFKSKTDLFEPKN